MKKRVLRMFVLIIYIMVGTSCANLTKIRQYPSPTIEVKSEYLLPQEGVIPVSLTTELPVKYSNWLTGIKFQPLFINEDNVVKELDPYIIEGIQHDIFNRRMGKYRPEKEDGIQYRDRFKWFKNTQTEYCVPVEYNTVPENASLYVDLYGSAFNKEIFLGRYLVTNGVLDLSQFIVFTPEQKYYYSLTDVNKRIIVGGDHENSGESILFNSNSSDLSLNKETDKALRDHLSQITSDGEVKDYKISISISNSPEGSLKHNRELGEQRLSSIEKYLHSLGVPQEKIYSFVTDEAWDSLRELLPSTDLENKNAIIEIINNTPDFDERDRLIRSRYPSDYQKMVKSVYPQLRVGEITVTTTYKGSEGVKYEYVYGEECNKINSFRMVFSKEPDINRLNQSLLDAVRMDDFILAEQIADRIPNLKANDIIRFNKATVYTEVGRYNEAKALLKSIKSIPFAKYNLGILQMQQNEYEEAAMSLEGFADINGAIAKLYVGENREALDILLLLDKSANRDYLLALAYSRIGKSRDAKAFLSEALLHSPSLKARAKSEPDFGRFNNDSDFQLLIK